MDKMMKYFKEHLPDTLYMTHYELEENFPDFSSNEWRSFLKRNENWIMMEVSAVTEAHARRALSSLASGALKSEQVSAIRQLLERSEQINKQNSNRKTFVILDQGLNEKHSNDDPSINKATYEKFFHLDEAKPEKKEMFLKSGKYIQNFDQTLHIKPPHSDLERAYLKLFNPTNALKDGTESYDPLDWGDAH